LNLAVGRALVDARFAAALLADPSAALGNEGCTPQQRLRLRGIEARSIQDFARQAEALFWTTRSALPNVKTWSLAAGL
jgi:hypothetical protein